jgi:hypothetical protein
MDGSSAGSACAVRVPRGAVCASAPAASSEQTPAKANDIAKVLKRILTTTQTVMALRSPIATATSTAGRTRFRQAGPAGSLHVRGTFFRNRFPLCRIML